MAHELLGFSRHFSVGVVGLLSPAKASFDVRQWWVFLGIFLLPLVFCFRVLWMQIFFAVAIVYLVDIVVFYFR